MNIFQRVGFWTAQKWQRVLVACLVVIALGVLIPVGLAYLLS